MTNYKNPNIPGVKLELLNARGSPLPVRRDGYVGPIKLHDETQPEIFKIRIGIDPKLFTGFCHRPENHPTARDWKVVKPVEPISGTTIYEMPVKVFNPKGGSRHLMAPAIEKDLRPVFYEVPAAKEGYAITRYGDRPGEMGNNMHLLRILPGGVVEDWTASLVSQDGEFFLCLSRGYLLQAYRNYQGELVYPKAGTRRVGLGQLHKKLLAPDDKIPDLSTYQPTLDHYDPKEGEGIVVQWNPAMQTGIIVVKWHGEVKDVKVHWRNIEAKREQLRHLIPGETVTVTAIEEIKGRGTTFSLQAIGVLPHSDFAEVLA